MITIDVFCTEHGVSKAALRTSYSSGGLSSNIYVNIRGNTYIDDKFVIRLFERRRRVINFLQSMYYFLNEHLSDSSIGYMIELSSKTKGNEAWIAYFLSLFKIKEGVMYFKLSKTDKKVFLCFRKLERRLKKLYPKFDIEDILDRRMLS